MFDSVQYIRELCKQRKIPVSALERALGFSNGYLNPKKLKKLPYDRAVQIAEYLSVPVEYILEGKKNPATVSGDGQADKLAQALQGIGIEVDKLSDAEISRIARLAKAALEE